MRTEVPLAVGRRRDLYGAIRLDIGLRHEMTALLIFRVRREFGDGSGQLLPCARLHDVAEPLGVLGKNGLNGWHSHKGGCGCARARWESLPESCAFPQRTVGFAKRTVRFAHHAVASPVGRSASGEKEVCLPAPRDRFAFLRRLIDRSPRRLGCSVMRVSHSRRQVGSPTPPIGAASCTIVSSGRTIGAHGRHDALRTRPSRLTAACNALFRSALRLVSDERPLIKWRDRVIEVGDALIGRSLPRDRAAASSRRAVASSPRATASSHWANASAQHAVASPRRDVRSVARRFALSAEPRALSFELADSCLAVAGSHRESQHEPKL
jgi:hypothetical protein